jgi:hypothetical protein
MSRFGSLDARGIQRLAADRENIRMIEDVVRDAILSVHQLIFSPKKAHQKSEMTATEIRALFSKVDQLFAGRFHSFTTLKKTCFSYSSAAKDRETGDDLSFHRARRQQMLSSVLFSPYRSRKAIAIQGNLATIRL